MARTRTEFVCQECGAKAPRWLGRCPGCGAWSSMVEEPVAQGGTRLAGGEGRSRAAAKPITRVDTSEENRISTGLSEFDRVLGGGMVPGSVILVGGDPGIGKSTLLLAACAGMSAGDRKVLYVSGEESDGQVKARADRIGACQESLYLAGATNLSEVLGLLDSLSPAAVVIDSIQTMSFDELASAPGSVSQVRECAARLVRAAKDAGCGAFMVGHVTKEGGLAGPRVLEHMVDTVLYFEGERGHPYRILRTVKNRYGSTNEIGLFEMTGAGLREVDNPSEMFLSKRAEAVSGSTVVAAVEGTRPLLVEIQALVAAPAGFGTPRRTCLGIDQNRVALLSAVLEKKAGLAMSTSDVFVNVAGGIKLVEPAVDLAAAVAMASSLLDKPVDPDTVVFGEVGLAGEVRPVGRADVRIFEAEKLGFRRAIMPAGNLQRMPAHTSSLECSGVETIGGALDAML